jgi:hypothetical protein
MDDRALGRTGISVSQLCLGAMMYDAAGNPFATCVDPYHRPRPDGTKGG